MADSVHRTYLWLLAALAMAAGCVMAIATVGRLDACRTRMEKRAAEYGSLAGIDARLRHMETALATWQERKPGQPAPVSVLATNIFGDLRVELRELPSTNAVSGLIVRRVEVTCQEAPFERAMQLVQRLDGLWPRWILVHMELKSTDQAGKGRVVMRFENISPGTAAPGPMQLLSPEPPATPPPLPPPPAPPAAAEVKPAAPEAVSARDPATDGPPKADGASTNPPVFRNVMDRIHKNLQVRGGHDAAP